MSEPFATGPATGDPSTVEIRRMVYPDLPQVIAIERRVFPTPWSLAMFVLELSKQSGVCLAATLPDYRRRPDAELALEAAGTVTGPEP